MQMITSMYHCLNFNCLIKFIIMFSIEDFKGILECVTIIKEDRQKIIKKKKV